MFDFFNKISWFFEYFFRRYNDDTPLYMIPLDSSKELAGAVKSFIARKGLLKVYYANDKKPLNMELDAYFLKKSWYGVQVRVERFKDSFWTFKSDLIECAFRPSVFQYIKIKQGEYEQRLEWRVSLETETILYTKLVQEVVQPLYIEFLNVS